MTAAQIEMLHWNALNRYEECIGRGFDRCITNNGRFLREELKAVISLAVRALATRGAERQGYVSYAEKAYKVACDTMWACGVWHRES